MAVSAARCRCITDLRAVWKAGRCCSQWKHTTSRVAGAGPRSSSSLHEARAESATPGTSCNNIRTFSTTTPSAKPFPPAKGSASVPVAQRDDKNFHRTNGNPSLPLPPFMRKTPRQKTSDLERNIKNPRPLIEGGYTEGNRKTLRAKLKEAEFATRMRENPYAHMLGEPVREDRFSQQRLSRHCMLRFQVVEDVTHTPETSHLEQGGRDKISPTKVQPKHAPNLVFLPLALMGEALPKTKNPQCLTIGEKAAVAALHEDVAFTPRGPGSHTLARYDMLAWVSAGSKQERMQRILSTRARDAIEEVSRGRRSTLDRTGPVVWQADMPELVLAAMRKVTKRLLAFMLKNKSSRPDREGIVMEVPQAQDGTVPLSLLDKVDEVMCVLRMGAANVPDERRSQHHPPQYVEMQWEAREKGSFLDGVKPLPACEEGPDARWPTLRYRTRRVMMYDLPALLGGQEQVRKLIKNTVFERSEWVVLRGSLGTTQLQQWLFRLHGYLTHGKGEQFTTATR